MSDSIKEASFVSRVALALGSLAVVAGVGWAAATMLNEKADASELDQVDDRVRYMERNLVTRDDLQKLEQKIDTLLLRSGGIPVQK